MKNQVAPKIETPDATQALLQDLIAECHAIIRDDILPGLRIAKDTDKRPYIHSVNDLMDHAVKLGDAIGRLRGTAPQPELRQRITVERIQSLPGPPLHPLSTARKEGG